MTSMVFRVQRTKSVSQRVRPNWKVSDDRINPFTYYRLQQARGTLFRENVLRRMERSWGQKLRPWERSKTETKTVSEGGQGVRENRVKCMRKSRMPELTPSKLPKRRYSWRRRRHWPQRHCAASERSESKFPFQSTLRHTRCSVRNAPDIKSICLLNKGEYSFCSTTKWGRERITSKRSHQNSQDIRAERT